MHPTLSLAALRDRGIHVEPHEAVAIALSLIAPASDVSTPLRPPLGAPSLDNVELMPDGRVACTGAAATPSVAEIAILIDALLSGALPGGLQYVIGRALHEVDAPPFDSLDDFARALMRFECGDRAEVVRGVLARADAAPIRLVERRRIVASPRRRLTAVAAGLAVGMALVAAGELMHVTRAALPPVMPQAAASVPLPSTPAPARATAPIRHRRRRVRPHARRVARAHRQVRSRITSS